MKGVRRTVCTYLVAALSLLPAALTQNGAAAQGEDPGGFRLFSIGYKQEIANAESYATWAASIEERIAQIKPLLVSDRPNVVVFPESVTLTSWLIGPRGAQARDENHTSLSAIASLAGPYAPQVAYYESKCNVPPSRALVLALTDTTWRAFGETFSRLAIEHGIYLVATADVAAEITRTTEPPVAQLLADPEAGTDYAYEAECDKAYNAAYFFAPTGEVFGADGSMRVGTVGGQIRGIVPKAYLVPIERDQTAGLALSSGNPADVRPVDLGFASFGVFTSKDAWMSDLPNRNDVDGADVFLQPEAGPWAGWDDTGVENWKQDAMHRALWGFVQKLPSIRYGALSNLMGNFYDLPFDGTPTLTADAGDYRYFRRGPPDERHYLLGRRVMDGIVARADWFTPDPPDGVGFGEIGVRRQRLWDEGAKRAPGSGDELENAYRDDAFVWMDVPARRDTAIGPRLDLGPAPPSQSVFDTQAAQWEPSLAASPDGDVLLAWTDLADGDEDPLVARRTADGWAAPVSAVPADSRPDDQQDNQYGVQIALAGDEVHAVWVDFRNQSWEVRASSAPIGTLEFSEDRRVDHAESSAEGFPNELLDNDPAVVAAKDGSVVAAWSDLRARDVDRDVRIARLADGGDWTGDDLVTRGSEDFHPSLAVVRGQPAVAWQNHRNGDADVYVTGRFDRCRFRRRGRDCADKLKTVARVDDGFDADAMTPALDGAPKGPLVVWSDDRIGVYQIRATLVSRAGRARRSITIAPGPGDQTYPAITRIARRRWVVAWTDERAGDTDIAATTLELSKRRLRIGDVVRVDDSGAAAARLPSLAYDGTDVWFAWEDRRDGPEQILVTQVPAELLFPPTGSP